MKEVVEEGQQYVRMEYSSFGYLFQSIWSSFKNLLKPICIKFPMYLDNDTLFNMFKTTEIEVYVYSYVGKRHGYMHAVCPSI